MKRELRDERTAPTRPPAGRRRTRPAPPSADAPPELLDELEAATLARGLAALVRAGAIDLDLGGDDRSSRARPARSSA